MLAKAVDCGWSAAHGRILRDAVIFAVLLSCRFGAVCASAQNSVFVENRCVGFAVGAERPQCY